MVLHLPIGLLVGLAFLELLELRRPARTPSARGALVALAWLTAAGAVSAAASGWLLSYEPGYGGWTLTAHLWLGITLAALCVAAAVAQTLARSGRVGPLRAYRWLLAGALLALVPGGHLGASMTHGGDFLLKPLGLADSRPTGAERPRAPEAAAVGASDSGVATASAGFAQAVAPVLEAHCIECHSGSRPKARLALDTAEGVLAGGRNGPVVLPGKPDESELLRRMRLPLDDEDHMPPADLPQPTPRQIEAIADWIAGGARAAAFQREETAIGPAEDESPTPLTPPGAGALSPAPPGAVAALRDRLVHVQPIAGDSALLWVDFAAAATLDEAVIIELLGPLRSNLADVCLARCRISPATMECLAGAPHLRRVDLREAGLDDAALAALTAPGAPSGLEEIVLVGSKLTAAAVESLLRLESLKRVYLWRSGLDEAAIERLAAARPDVAIDTGEDASRASVEVEGEIRLSSDAPLPGQPTGDARLSAVNALCPVSGSAVNPQILVVFEGRVIGFCCPNCPKEFWANPAAYRAKLPPEVR